MPARQRSALFQYVLVLGYVFLVMALCRVAFWCAAASEMPDPLSADAWKAFYIGLRFDARIAALFTLPIAFVLSVPWLAQRLATHARLAMLLYAPLFFLLAFVYAVDFGFYDYLGSRVGALVFELLADTAVAVEMVVESYPVALIALGLFAATGLLALGFYRLLQRPVIVVAARSRRIAGFVCGFVLFAFAVYGQLNASLFPLRWSQAFFTTNEAIVALGLNPVQNLYDTSNVSMDDYSVEKVAEAYPRMATFLLVDKPDSRALSYVRSFPPTPGVVQAGVAAPEKKPLNVIFIVMESFAYPKSSFAPGNADPTPYAAKLAKESLLFHRFFANSRTTARAMFTLMTGIPDVNIGSTGSRNPMVVDQRVVGNEFDGYDKYYLLGGNTSWANIRAIFAQNITGLNILEEGDWTSPRVDVWGISDYDLFKEAHQVFMKRNREKPFWAVIQTAGFHSPYTIPEAPGFSHARLSEEDARNYAFDSEEEYNSMRFSDFALGSFMEWAKQSDYYDNTVFFIFGDHGLNDPSTNMPAGYDTANLAPWHVPLLVHAAPSLGVVPVGESNMLGSHIDLFPTAAGLAGVGYKNYTLGRDLFDARYDDSRAVYIGGKEKTAIRLLSGPWCYYDNQSGKEGLFLVDSSEAKDYSGERPDLFARFRQMAWDIDATARYMLFTNKKTETRDQR